MNIDKYSDNNIFKTDPSKIHSIYEDSLRFLPNLRKDSRVLEIWPWDWSYSIFISNEFGIKMSNFDLIDMSKSVVHDLKNSNLTMEFNCYLSDTIDFLKKNKKAYDLIVMRSIIEHMDKQYINILVDLLVKSLTANWQIFIETPNLLNSFIGIPMFYSDYSHQTWFTSKSIFDAFYWNTEEKILIKSYNYIKKVKHGWITFFIKDLLRYFIESISTINTFINHRIYWSLSKDINIVYTPLLITTINKKNDK
ncbi:MAG: methyltransferase type 12 [uncultured bacterium (gcode 4)]|uniref:Methyltransferase type 12 n=1 Tax=uncultured bacterium (gcode 4) TaxID=1234023 RepID=K2GWM5_9BACT|nr:MAG: methyltransferase type 12 [uncultured bacterium (gcode 4)]